MSESRSTGEQPFSIHMLFTDVRYRAQTLQFFILLVLAIFIWWVLSNAAANLAAVGKSFSFVFLSAPASYEISFSAIFFDAESTHLRAVAVGLINTILVALFACVTATVLGVIIGIGRLSKNPVIARSSAAYVEIVRNIPLLLILLVIYAVLINFLPSPREAEMLFGMVVSTNRGFSVPMLTLNWPLTVLTVSVLLLWFASFFVKTERESRIKPILYTLAITISLVLVALIVFAIRTESSAIGVSLPVLKGFNYFGGFTLPNSAIALWLALSLYHGSMIAENVRSGLQAVSPGQGEASWALGLNGRQAMGLIILPQAVPMIIPPLISQFLNIVKNSSLAIAVGYPDLTAILGGLTLAQTGREIECILLLIALYLLLSLIISAFINLYNARVAAWKTS